MQGPCKIIFLLNCELISLARGIQRFIGINPIAYNSFAHNLRSNHSATHFTLHLVQFKVNFKTTLVKLNLKWVAFNFYIQNLAKPTHELEFTRLLIRNWIFYFPFIFCKLRFTYLSSLALTLAKVLAIELSNYLIKTWLAGQARILVGIRQWSQVKIFAHFALPHHGTHGAGGGPAQVYRSQVAGSLHFHSLPSLRLLSGLWSNTWHQG